MKMRPWQSTFMVLCATVFAIYTLLYCTYLHDYDFLDVVKIKLAHTLRGINSRSYNGTFDKEQVAEVVHLNQDYCEKNQTCGDSEAFSKSSCLMLKSAWNRRMSLREPDKLAEFNCSHFVVVDKTHKFTGLGNHMFQAASAIGLAGWHGYTPLLHTSNILGKVFKLINRYRSTVRNTQCIKEKVCCEQNEIFYSLDHSQNVTLNGYLQSWRYFTGSEARVRKAFTFKNRITEAVKTFLANVKRHDCITVGIHVRRGDITSIKNQYNGYTITPRAYIWKAKKRFRSMFDNIQFIFVSDDISWCKKHFGREKDTFFSPFSRREYDLALLASCDHVIITSGSFGWWGAWLAGGITMYYGGYPTPNSWLETQFGWTNSSSDYYPPDWIKIF